MLDKEKKKYGEIVLDAYRKHGPVLCRFQVDKLTGLNELQSRAGIIYLLNQQILTETGYLDPGDPYSSFELTTLAMVK